MLQRYYSIAILFLWRLDVSLVRVHWFLLGYITCCKYKVFRHWGEIEFIFPLLESTKCIIRKEDEGKKLIFPFSKHFLTRLPKQDVTAPVSDLLEGWNELEFYGQRPWRPGKHSLEPPEQQREAEGIRVRCPSSFLSVLLCGFVSVIYPMMPGWYEYMPYPLCCFIYGLFLHIDCTTSN